jgi:hypothetical protein
MANLDQAIAGLRMEHGPTEKPDENQGLMVDTSKDLNISEADRSLARTGLAKLNEQVDQMVSIHKQELERGLRDSGEPQHLAVVKSINDQFNFIWKISEDLLKTLRA